MIHRANILQRHPHPTPSLADGGVCLFTHIEEHNMRKLSERRAMRAMRAKKTITPAQAERVIENLRLALTFIDTNIPAEITEPNREGRMGIARAVLHDKRTDDYGELVFMLLTLVDFVMANYAGPMTVLKDAFDVLVELGRMHRVEEDITPGHQLFGQTGLDLGTLVNVPSPAHFNQPARHPDVIERIERAKHIARCIARSLGADHVDIDGDDVYVIKNAKAVHYIAGRKVKRMLSGAEPITVGEWELLAPDQEARR
jgi:hypothetical protein